MLNVDKAAVTVVAGDARAALGATDQALRANAQMLLSFIDGAGELPMQVTQGVYTAINASERDILASRENLQKTITLLTAIKNRSTHRELALGCPGGTPPVMAKIRDAASLDA